MNIIIARKNLIVGWLLSRLKFRISCFILLFATLLVNGQDPVLNFSHLTINDGLSQNTVYCVIQDQDDFIWIGTKDGLNKYDGYNFSIYKHEVNDSTSIIHSQVNALLEDSRGNLWVGTAGGLNRFDRNTENFIFYPLELDAPSNAITSLIEDKNGNIWIGTFDGLILYDVEKNQFFKFKPDLDKIDYASQNSMVHEVFEDESGILWVGIGNDLLQFDPLKKSFLPLPASLREISELRNSQVRVIKQDKAGNFWIGTEYAGLFLYEPQKQEVSQYSVENPQGLPSNMVRYIYISNDDKVWIGTREGLGILDLQTNSIASFRYDKLNNKTLTHNSIRTIIEDNSGSIWLGTFAGGLNIFHQNNNNFFHIKEHVSDLPGINHRVVSSLIEEEDGIWIGTEGGGLNYLNKSTGDYSYFTQKNTHGKLPGDNIKCLESDADGNLWIGTYEGLSFFNKKDNTITQIFPGSGNNHSNHQIYSLSLAENGLWIGTNGGGLYHRSKDGTLKKFIYDPADSLSISGNNIITLLNDEEGVWIGTEQGLNYFNKDSQKFSRYYHDYKDLSSISSNSILSIFKDSRDLIWIGTEGGGLNLFDKQRNGFYALTERYGLANNVIHAIEEDDSGNLWVSTNKGLSQVILKETITGESLANLKINNYVVEDGLQSNQFLTGSVNKGQNGRLLFGGINGITIFHPEKIVHNTNAPKVVITEFLINNRIVDFKAEDSPLNKPVSYSDNITLDHDEASVTFKFSALNFVNPEKNRYAYRLRGFTADDEWNYIGNQRNATYTNMAPGDYTFEVKGTNNDGVWSEVPASVQLNILPPVWKTWWAFVLYAAVIIFLLFLFYTFSTKNAHLKNQLAFEHLAHAKDQELNHRKHKFFTNISHEIKTPLTLILTPLEKLIKMNEGNNMMLNQLMLMQRNGDRLLKLLNQLLDFRKFETGSMDLKAAEGNIVRFVREVFIAFESYANNKHIHLELSTVKEEINVWFDRDKMEKILYNLLSNAIKFTPEEGKISLNIKLEEEKDGIGSSYVILEVEDNGVGIPEENLEKVFERYHNFNNNNSEIAGTGIGLAFTKGLVELHQGKISVVSNMPATGIYGYTCFRIMLPLGRSHLNDEQIISDFQSSEDIIGYQFDKLPSDKTSKEKKKRILEAGNEPIMLLVEDNVDVLQMVSDHFSTEFKVYTASNGEEGVKLAIELIPDIIISDVMMPKMNGIDLCNKIKCDHRTSHIPVILLTARTPLIYKIEGFETGADDYITKPFNFYILEARVFNLLESRRKLRDRFRKESLLQPKEIAISSPDEKFLEKVILFIEKNISEPGLNVEELGKEVGMSRITLYRKIKAITNQTVVEFIRSFRLKRAAQLLTENKLHINEIAYMVGFQDVDYFRKCFKEQYDCTPTEFAKGGQDKILA